MRAPRCPACLRVPASAALAPPRQRAKPPPRAAAYAPPHRLQAWNRLLTRGRPAFPRRGRPLAAAARVRRAQPAGRRGGGYGVPPQRDCAQAAKAEAGLLDKQDTRYLSLPVNTYMKCPVKDCHQHVIFQSILDVYHENHVMVQKVRQMTEDHEKHVSVQKVRQITEDTSCVQSNPIHLTRKIYDQKENFYFLPGQQKQQKRVYKRSITFQVFCQFCNARFASKGSLTKHINKRHHLSKITCGACFNSFSGEKSFKRHVQQGCIVQHKDPKHLKMF